MVNIDITVDIEFYCAECGAGICANAEAGTTNRGDPKFTITPCKVCLEKARDEGYKEAKEEIGE